MPRELKERLRGFVDRTTAIQSAVGFVSLTLVSLALPDLRDWPKLVSGFSTYSDAFDFFKPKLLPFLLILVRIFWYYRYKDAVLNELNLIDEAFEENHSPVYLGRIERHRIIPYVGYILVLTYIGLILAAPYVWLYCLICLVLHVVDLIGGSITMQNLGKTFSDFSLSNSPEGLLIARQRSVLIQYYYGNHTLPRIGVLLVITASTLVFSLIAPTGLPQPVYFAPYIIMISNILIGELIIQRWRNERDRKLKEIMIEKDKLRSGA
jgi:hypothetical protein